MKKIIFVIIAVLFCYEAVRAQNKGERRIYLWDVSLSMKGKAKQADGKPTPNIYDDVVDALCKSVNNLINENTEIIVLPFYNGIDESGIIGPLNASEEGKNKITGKIRRYSNNKIDYTNICGAIASVMNHYLDHDKRNIVYLFTDGQQETSWNKPLPDVLREWRFKASDDDYFLYVMLTQDAHNAEIIETLDAMPNGDVIEDPGNYNIIDLEPAGLITYNIEDDRGKAKVVSLKQKQNDILPSNIQIRVQAETSYFTINEVVTLKNSEIQFDIKFKQSYSYLQDNLPDLSDYIIYLELVNADEIKAQTKGTIIKLYPKEIKMELINKPEKTLRIHVKK
ncbi:MAG: hypothetical protein LBE11_03990 [Prevotellaceae bacterium]|jgi:hypothetical protein|nr:hypothetical protein [Prevotellaceae bacterium]